MDWKSIVEGLIAGGLSQAQIAARCEVGQATISDLARGATKEPRFALGARLIALRDEVANEPPKEASQC